MFRVCRWPGFGSMLILSAGQRSSSHLVFRGRLLLLLLLLFTIVFIGCITIHHNQLLSLLQEFKTKSTWIICRMSKKIFTITTTNASFSQQRSDSLFHVQFCKNNSCVTVFKLTLHLGILKCQQDAITSTIIMPSSKLAPLFLWTFSAPT